MNESAGESLAMVNAILNGTSATLLLLGYAAIKRGTRQVHQRFMLSAFGASALFLGCYLTRVWLTGTHRDPHVGFLHALYIAILSTHMILAIVVVPLVLTALYLAYKGRFERHRRIARWTFPIWLYVSVTGVLVYVILYRVPV